MTSRDDRFLEMLTDAQFDRAIDLMLRGIVVEPELEPLARFADAVQALVDGPPPRPSSELSALLAGQPLDDDALSVGAARTVVIARACLPAGAASGQSGTRGAIARVSARVAAMSLAAKAGLGLALAGAAGAGATGVLPDPIVDAVRHTIEVVTPFELPDRSSVEAATGADLGPGDPPETGDSSGAGSGGGTLAGRLTGPAPATQPAHETTATKRAGGGSWGAGPSAVPSAPVEPTGIPALGETRHSPGPASAPKSGGAPDEAGDPSGGEPPGDAGIPKAGGPPGDAGHPTAGNPHAGGPPDDAGDPGRGPPGHAGDPKACGAPNGTGNPNAGGPASQPGTSNAGGPPPGKAAGRPGGPSSSHGSDPATRGHAAPGAVDVPRRDADGPPSTPPPASSTTHGRPSATSGPREPGGSVRCAAAACPDGQ